MQRLGHLALLRVQCRQDGIGAESGGGHLTHPGKSR